jgi:hypothetical protein
MQCHKLQFHDEESEDRCGIYYEFAMIEGVGCDMQQEIFVAIPQMVHISEG